MSTKKFYFLKNLSMLVIALGCGENVWSAQPIDLKNHHQDVWQLFVANRFTHQPSFMTIKEVNRYTDANHVTHIRLQEFYQRYPIWNAHAVIHVDKQSAEKKSLNQLLITRSVTKQVNGTLYNQLDADLQQSKVTLGQVQAGRAKQAVIDAYRASRSDKVNLTIRDVHQQLVVFIDKHHVARWAYKIDFYVPGSHAGELPAHPLYIVDAEDFKVYQSWDEIKTAYHSESDVQGGGFGGNQKRGRVSYDGLPGNLSSFLISRDVSTKICTFKNRDVDVIDNRTDTFMQFPCEKPDEKHNGVYWSGSFDEINGGYSPANDAMFGGSVVMQLYQQWYNTPALIDSNGQAAMLHMIVHIPKMDNAYWDGATMNFGDGYLLYPLTSLSVMAHEISHGFTEQHSALYYANQSGGMNEAFSDMASQAAEYFAYGKNDWMIGSDVIKLDNEALRYMDKPSKDCHGKEPGTYCSIDQADQYYDGLDVHYSSGVYNRAFYLLSTTAGWDPRKAFAVMLQANASYWLPETNFEEGAACAVKAALDLHYDTQAVVNAYKAVGILAESPCTSK